MKCPLLIIFGLLLSGCIYSQNCANVSVNSNTIRFEFGVTDHPNKLQVSQSPDGTCSIHKFNAGLWIDVLHLDSIPQKGSLIVKIGTSIHYPIKIRYDQPY